MIDNVMGINFKGASFENDTTLQYLKKKIIKEYVCCMGKMELVKVP